MAIPAYRRTANIRLSVLRKITTATDAQGRPVVTVTTRNPQGALVNLTVPLLMQDWTADPESARDPAGNADRVWVGLTWVQDGAGWRSESILQVDVFSRVRAHGAATGDQFGDVAADVADRILDPFNGIDADGRLRAEFPVYDFKTDPDDPPETEWCLAMQARGIAGGVGVPIERRSFMDDGFHRVTMRLAFRLNKDRVPGAVYREDD